MGPGTRCPGTSPRPLGRDDHFSHRSGSAMTVGLGHYLAVAQHDYRDVLYWADHPEQAPKR